MSFTNEYVAKRIPCRTSCSWRKCARRAWKKLGLRISQFPFLVSTLCSSQITTAQIYWGSWSARICITTWSCTLLRPQTNCSTLIFALHIRSLCAHDKRLARNSALFLAWFLKVATSDVWMTDSFNFIVFSLTFQILSCLRRGGQNCKLSGLRFQQPCAPNILKFPEKDNIAGRQGTCHFDRLPWKFIRIYSWRRLLHKNFWTNWSKGWSEFSTTVQQIYLPQRNLRSGRKLNGRLSVVLSYFLESLSPDLRGL